MRTGGAFRRTTRDAPPGPRGGFLGGNLESFERDRLGFLLATHREFGDVVRFDRRTTLLSGPDLPAEILLRRAGEFAIRENFLQRRIPADELDDWLTARRLLNPALRRHVVERVVDQIGVVAATVLSSQVGHPPCDAMTLLERITAESIARVYFGAGGSEVPAASDALLEELGKVIGNPFSLPAAFPTPTRRRIAARAEDLRRLVRELVRQRWSRPRDFDDLTALLVARIDRSDLDLVDRVADLLVGSLLAGHRVPAAATAWLLHLVQECQDPLLRTTLDAEAQAFAAAGAPLSSYPVARSAVLESLRLYPPTWLIARTSRRPVSVAGYDFPGNHVFLLSPYVLHRDPRSFESPEDFVPGRWQLTDPHRGTYLPFGLGPRGCPGSHLAMATMTIVLLLSLGRFRVSVTGVPTPDPRTTLLPRGLRVSAGLGGVGHVPREALPRRLA